LEVVSKRPGRPESVVEMFEFFEHLGRWCIAFETLGPSLYEFQKTHQFRPYPLSAVRDIIRQSIEALAYVHSLELVHTDIKPENICLVSGEARKPGAPASTKIRLIDFGTAEWCAKDGHRNALVSTRQYRAPEVVMGLGWNHVADLWAIGCVVIEMLAGRQIFPTVRHKPLLFLSFSFSFFFLFFFLSLLLLLFLLLYVLEKHLVVNDFRFVFLTYM
jgi:serine/threonine protein kinase